MLLCAAASISQPPPPGPSISACPHCAHYTNFGIQQAECCLPGPDVAAGYFSCDALLQGIWNWVDGTGRSNCYVKRISGATNMAQYTCGGQSCNSEVGIYTEPGGDCPSCTRPDLLDEQTWQPFEWQLDDGDNATVTTNGFTCIAAWPFPICFAV